MSAGDFQRSKYQSREGNIYRIRIQPETLGLTLGGTANSEPTGAIDQEVTAYVNKGAREYGIGARQVKVRYTGTLPDGYSGEFAYVPVLDPTVFDGYSRGDTGTYLGADVELEEKFFETIK